MSGLWSFTGTERGKKEKRSHEMTIFQLGKKKGLRRLFICIKNKKVHAALAAVV